MDITYSVDFAIGGNTMVDYILNPYVLINVLWQITLIIIAVIIRRK
tara:strand:+ start:489 stop:626 length:138 start_codon:yes stop_codon:yes gene_type:complete